jgi:hypothetical protein
MGALGVKEQYHKACLLQQNLPFLFQVHLLVCHLYESSYIDDDVKIGEGTKVWHFSHIHSGLLRAFVQVHNQP